MAPPEDFSKLIFVAVFIGVRLPTVYRVTKKQLERDSEDGSDSRLNQEPRLLFAIIDAPTISIAHF